MNTAVDQWVDQQHADIMKDVPAPENSPEKTADIMARMFEIREERREIKERDSELVQEWEALEATLLARMDEQGSVRVSSKEGTASVSEQVLPSVDDWDAVFAYMKEHDAFHLVQKRLATAAFREMLELGEAVPGTRPITKKSINLRAS